MVFMPWKEQTVEHLRCEFVVEVLAGEITKSKLCAKYGISRVTGDKWIDRYQNGQGFADRSRAPFHSPKKTNSEVEQLVINVRLEHPAWGARKIVRHLKNQGFTDLPAQSTVCAILSRAGLVTKEASQAATPYKRFQRQIPNELWQVDFKGHFQMKNNARCYPLTAIDDHSRFALCVDAKDNERYDGVVASFVNMFELYGLPLTVLCDNGNPWGLSQLTGYTRFEIWLMQRDVLPIHGRPRHPQTQGKEERFNRTLGDEVLKHKDIENLAHAQAEFDDFRLCYNNIRPHGALNLDTPAMHYVPSKRCMPRTIQEWDYPSGHVKRRVKRAGYFSYLGQNYYLGEAFMGKNIALRESSINGCINLYYRNFRIARLNMDEKCFISRKIYRIDDGD